jgi:ribonuclease III
MKPVVDYFKNPEFLEQAFRHRSYCNEHPGTESNERLEFLGDSVLSLIISHRLYLLFPKLPEGELTNRRSQIVQTISLAQKASELGLDQKLLLSKGEEDSGGRSNPSLLANTFEAVLGTLFLDSGIETCYQYLSDVFPDSELTSSTETKDPKSLLQEKSQSHGWGTPIYHLVSQTGPDHAREFVLSVNINNQEVCTGTGTSKQRAEIAAAKAALEKLFPE